MVDPGLCRWRGLLQGHGLVYATRIRYPLRVRSSCRLLPQADSSHWSDVRQEAGEYAIGVAETLLSVIEVTKAS
jgi:hypothetical protein